MCIRYPHKNLDEQILRNPIDSFKTNDKWENTLPPGNYMKVAAKKNELTYSLIEKRSANLKLLTNNYDLRFILVDQAGKAINNALVQFNNHTVTYDSKVGLYITNPSKRDTILKVDYAGVTNYYVIKKQQRSSYYYNRYHGMSFFKATWQRFKNLFKGRNQYMHRQPDYNYEGFMVFNKAIYKPHDTVKFKAFILNKKSKQSVNAPQLLVRLKERYDKDGKVIGKVNSYRRGAYEYSFALTDSLDLSLDEDYTISLEDPSSEKYKLDDYDGNDDQGFLAKRKVYLTGQFKYEEYELKSITFNTRVDKEEHWPGNPATLYLKAVDENNLPVTDGRVTVTLNTRGTGMHRQNYTFVPDQLWTHQLQLDPVGETKLIIPDSIFPKADVTYTINSEFLNSNNEQQSADNSMSYRYNRFNITTKLNGDTLITNAFDNGTAIQTMATISALNAKNDTISTIRVMLPSKTTINPYADSYDIETDSTYTDLDLAENNSGISLSGYRTADSLFVKVENPRHLHFWYSVFGGNKLIDAGQADNLFYTRAYNDQNLVNFQVHFIWAGESKTEATDIMYRDKLLTINIRQPISVYPGQLAKTDIVVTDAKGQPVPNADLTAWSMTSKFTDYKTPYVPYLSKGFTNRKQKASFNTGNVNSDGALQLNWKRWSKDMGLDSIAYYQFTHPNKIYRVEEDAKDSITQVAPFIVKNGDVLPVHILYIDDRPVYFDQTQQLKRYSFAVSPGKHIFRFRTSHQNIWVDSVDVQKSKKLIFSINADNAHSTKVLDTLSTYECGLINRYLITVINSFGWKMALLTQNDRIFMVNPNPNYGYRNNNVLIGPLAENFANLNVQSSGNRYFVTESGYSFLFEPGLIKQKSIPTAYPFNPILSSYHGPADDYTQQVLTQPEAESIWQQYLDLRSNTQQLFVNPDITGETGKLSMNIDQSKDKKLLIKNVIIYKYDDPDFFQIYPGNTTYINSLNAGRYRVLFLLKGDSYDIKENVTIKTGGTNFYNFTVLPAYGKDSVGTRIGNIINNRTGGYNNSDREIENDALKIKEAFNDKYLDTGNFGDMMSGTVIASDDKLAVPGVTVRVRGSSTGTLTDAAGHFKLKVPKTGKLIVSFIGYETQEVNIQPGATVRISLKSSSKSLQEVVIIGYGSVKKSAFLSSVATVSSLEGRVAGVIVGDGNNIMIRGINSSPSAQPLIVVDGEIVNKLSDINKDDIAEISVLKDAAATAIYGARGANGVIVIRTKTKPGLAGSQRADSTQAGSGQTMRKNFSDYAYWQPKLTTDEHGKASFMATSPTILPTGELLL
jgi:TonB-dependent SusC/RagA subfamily outer membrane receptor